MTKNSKQTDMLNDNLKLYRCKVYGAFYFSELIKHWNIYTVVGLFIDLIRDQIRSNIAIMSPHGCFQSLFQSLQVQQTDLVSTTIFFRFLKFTTKILIFRQIDTHLNTARKIGQKIYAYLLYSIYVSDLLTRRCWNSTNFLTFFLKIVLTTKSNINIKRISWGTLFKKFLFCIKKRYFALKIQKCRMNINKGNY